MKGPFIAPTFGWRNGLIALEAKPNGLLTHGP